MNIDNALGACRQATLHQLVVCPEICRIEYATNNIICEILPGYSKTKYVEVVLRGKMLHLCGTTIGHGNAIGFAGSVFIA